MGFTGNPNILFILSGVSQGKFIFDQNPESYDVVQPKNYRTIINILEGENIYMRPLLDNEVRIMKWGDTTRLTFTGLLPYTMRTISGTIPISYFWDGTVNEFSGRAVQVLDVYGEPLPNKNDRWRVELSFKPV